MAQFTNITAEQSPGMTMGCEGKKKRKVGIVALQGEWGFICSPKLCIEAKPNPLKGIMMSHDLTSCVNMYLYTHKLCNRKQPLFSTIACPCLCFCVIYVMSLHLKTKFMFIKK